MEIAARVNLQKLYRGIGLLLENGNVMAELKLDAMNDEGMLELAGNMGNYYMEEVEIVQNELMVLI